MNLYSDCYTRVFTSKAEAIIYPVIDKYIKENINIEEIISKLDMEYVKYLEKNNDFSLFELSYNEKKGVLLSYFDPKTEEEINFKIEMKEKFYYGLEYDGYDYSDGYFLYGTKEERIEEANTKIVEIQNYLKTLT